MERIHYGFRPSQFKSSDPFTLIATQNPLEQEGTYPLPEAQVDRFLFQTKMTMPSAGDMAVILQRSTGSQLPVLRSVADGNRILKMREIIRNVTISDALCAWCVGLLDASQAAGGKRSSDCKGFCAYGIGPRE